MGGLFSKPKAPKPSAEQLELQRQQIAEKRRLEAEEEKRKMAMRRGRGGRSSLMTEESPKGRDTLGGA